MIYEDNTKYKIEYIGEKFSRDLLSYKVIILGRYGVGKTTTIRKLMNKECEEEYAPTKTIDIKNIQAKVNDQIMQISIWDCCGNDKYASNIPNLYKNASITILVYAINNKESYNDLEKWINILKENSYNNVIFLLGNKNDLEDEREITMEKGEEFKNKYDNIKIFFETSALYGKNMDKLLENIVISIYEQDKKLANDEDNAVRKTITIVKEDLSEKKGKKKKKNCC